LEVQTSGSKFKSRLSKSMKMRSLTLFSFLFWKFLDFKQPIEPLIPTL
jgi:hypothetical protein